jgi:hypothetical protein
MPTGATAPPLYAGNATQPVFRNGLFANTSTLAFTLNPPPFDIVALPCPAAGLTEAPWEKGFTFEALGTSVVRVPSTGKLRVYYGLRWNALDSHGVPVSHTAPTPDMFVTAMAESQDGVHWDKPALPGKPFNSSLNGFDVSASNIIGCCNVVWVTDKGPLPDQFWGAADAGDAVGVKIWHSKDGIDWSTFSTVKIPDLNGMGGLDTMQDMFWDPQCACHALFTRLWHGHSKTTGYQDSYRMVRRLNINLSVPAAGVVTKQEIVLQADAEDLSTHKPVLDFPALDFYGATAWVRVYGDGQQSTFMAPARYWHWQGGTARVGEGGEPATYDIPLLVSANGFNFSYLGRRQPIVRPSLASQIGNSRLW